jgi:hypothetical protein
VTPRARGFKNQERVNRLLMLMQLHLIDRADVEAYTSTIRDWLQHRGPLSRASASSATIFIAVE